MTLVGRKGRKVLQFKGMRIYIVIAAVVVTLAILLTLQYVHQKYNVEQPLFKLYSETKLVKDVKLEEKGSTVKVILDVNKTDNLRKAYQDLNTYTQEIMGNTEFTIELKDKRSKDLEKAYYNSQFIIYEAIAKGDFTRMADIIRKNAKAVNAESMVFIDENNIYVEFIKGGNYLYEIVPRQQKAAGIADTMGSDQR